MTPLGRTGIRLGLVAVAVAGLAALTLAAVTGGQDLLEQASPSLWTVAALVVATELFLAGPPGRGEGVAASGAFALALLLGWGVAAGMLVYAFARAVGGLRHRRHPGRVALDLARHGLAMGAAGVAWAGLGGRTPFSAAQLPAFAAAALAFAAVDNLPVRATAALADGRRPASGLVDGAGFGAWTSAMLLGMAPVTVLVAERSWVLLPLLLLPVGAVHLASRGAVRAIANRAVAEEHARAAAAMAADHARLAEAEREVVRQLQEQGRLKTDLLAAVSHELRTPLTGILGSVKTLQARGHVLSPEQRRSFLVMANQEGERLKGLIEQLLLASHFQSTPSEPSIHPLVDAAEVVNGAAEALEADHPDRRLAICASGPLPVLAAPEAILRVLANLLDNAVKWSPPDAPVRVEAYQAHGHVVVAVQDAGPGVPPGDRERIFEWFTQVDSGVTRPRGGIGLGLYVARQLARAQGGELVLATGAGDGAPGARFELRLPLAAVDGGDRAALAAGRYRPAS
jgi:signal transduction histidine kinase